VNTGTIFSITLYLASAVFVAVEIALLFSLFRARRFRESLQSNGDTEQPRPWEAVWSAIPAAILLVLILMI
jgi:heme/copper-type cytochrome/quinol oxidase subunit 2